MLVRSLITSLPICKKIHLIRLVIIIINSRLCKHIIHIYNMIFVNKYIGFHNSVDANSAGTDVNGNYLVEWLNVELVEMSLRGFGTVAT